MSEVPKTLSNPKAIIVIGLMFAVFIVPYIYILHIYRSSEVPTGHSTERGTFFEPFINLDAYTLVTRDGEVWQSTQLAHKWTLANFADKGCDDLCLNRIFNIQQGISTLTEYRGQVDQLVFLGSTLEIEESLETVLKLKKEKASVLDDAQQGLFTAIATQISEQLPEQTSLSSHVAIIDPQGQMLLYYTPEQTIQEILRDLKRLLKASAGRRYE